MGALRHILIRILRWVEDICIRSRRLILAAVGVMFLLWLVLAAPALIIPARSDASLKDVTDAAKRHDLQDARLALQNDIRTTLLQALGGVVVLLGAWGAWRQLNVSREGQITDRFTRATDQLGSSQLDVKLGGIYALARIAKDSPADRAAIIEILSIYIRNHAPWPPQSGQSSQSEPLERIPPLQKRAPDVHAALNVLARSPFPEYRGAAGREILKPLDLSHTDLRKSNLWRAHLDEVDLQGAHLEGAELCEARMLGGIFNNAHLEGVNLQDSFLGSADFRGAHLEGASLRFANVTPSHRIGSLSLAADFSDAHLGGADLRDANLYGVYLGGANLEGVDLRNARLVKARATATTRWPDGFDWQAAGVVLTNSDG